MGITSGIKWTVNVNVENSSVGLHDIDQHKPICKQHQTTNSDGYVPARSHLSS